MGYGADLLGLRSRFRPLLNEPQLHPALHIRWSCQPQTLKPLVLRSLSTAAARAVFLLLERYAAILESTPNSASLCGKLATFCTLEEWTASLLCSSVISALLFPLHLLDSFAFQPLLSGLSVALDQCSDCVVPGYLWKMNLSGI